MPECDDTRRKRVLIINEGTLLAAGLQNLLSGYPNLDVVAFAPHCRAELIAELERFRPDMILLACDGVVSTPPELLAMLGEHPLVRIVSMTCDLNTVVVYDRSSVTVTALDDLVALIPPGANISHQLNRTASLS
jgi:DNA-binding NarL/FixJ family response regulator